jgi:hypothetical protein
MFPGGAKRPINLFQAAIDFSDKLSKPLCRVEVTVRRRNVATRRLDG